MPTILLKIKSFINYLSYQSWSIRIMSDAMEYDIEPHIVNSWLEANYINHFGDTGFTK